MNTNVNDLYRLQDGTQADPKDVSKGKDGVWRHKNGLTVLLNDKGEPQTIGEAAAASNPPQAQPEQKPEEKANAEEKQKVEPAKAR